MLWDPGPKKLPPRHKLQIEARGVQFGEERVLANRVWAWSGFKNLLQGS